MENIEQEKQFTLRQKVIGLGLEVLLRSKVQDWPDQIELSDMNKNLWWMDLNAILLSVEDKKIVFKYPLDFASLPSWGQ